MHERKDTVIKKINKTSLFKKKSTYGVPTDKKRV